MRRVREEAQAHRIVEHLPEVPQKSGTARRGGVVTHVERAWQAVVEAIMEIDPGAERDSAIAAVQEWAAHLALAMLEDDPNDHEARCLCDRCVHVNKRRKLAYRDGTEIPEE